MDQELMVADKVALAAEAAEIRVEDLEDFCGERGLSMDDVSRWATAHSIGGEAGVRALVQQWDPGRTRGRELSDGIRDALRVYRPRRLRVRAEGSRFTVEEVKALTRREVVHTPVFQVRLVEVEDGERWFLFWRRAAGTWWPYAGRPWFDTAEDAVREAHRDPHRCFKLHPVS